MDEEINLETIKCDREIKLQCTSCFEVFMPKDAKQKEVDLVGAVDLCCPKCWSNFLHVSAYKIYPKEQKKLDDYATNG